MLKNVSNSFDAMLTGERPTWEEIAGVPDFWDRVRAAPHRLLAIDYDGTLAPFRVARERAVPLEGVKAILEKIRLGNGTSLAILSGRPAWQILELMGRDLPIPIFGSHGWEFIHPDGRDESYSMSEKQEEGVAQATVFAVDIGYEEQLERKVAGVALHTRGTPNPLEIEERFRNLWQPLAQAHDLAVMTFNRGVELRALGHNKGTALEELYRTMPAQTLPVYIGDDTTDEDAFRVIKSSGIGIKVGSEGETEAVGRVPDPAAVLKLLQDWLAATSVPAQT